VFATRTIAKRGANVQPPLPLDAPPAAAASARERSTAAQQPNPVSRKRLPARTYAKSPGVHARREFGFEG
jgi:hypothetical protein